MAASHFHDGNASTSFSWAICRIKIRVATDNKIIVRFIEARKEAIAPKIFFMQTCALFFINEVSIIMLKFPEISKKKGKLLLERLFCSVIKIKIIYLNRQMCYDKISNNKRQLHKTARKTSL
jgi:hypothetical protein